ncbi:MAG: hypothetical protein LBG42_03375 [Treponema sp.]|jgi:predicted adenylyl cyclase CyaB|nr:hypothetical protein [Treponema sp.]
MALEMEIKARVDDPEMLRVRLSDLGLYLGAYEKDDTYWFPAHGADSAGENGPARPKLPPSGIRVRRERNTRDGGVSENVLVTWKTGNLDGGIEINDEMEFAVSDAGLFEDLLERLGMRPGIRKNKQGWAWNCLSGDDCIRTELSNVRELGWFLELEITEENAKKREEDPVREKDRRKRLLSLLEDLGIPRGRIESRPYTRMLSEKRENPSLRPDLT